MLLDHEILLAWTSSRDALVAGHELLKLVANESLRALLTFRYGRIEVLAGFVNAVALFFAAFGIIWEAGERLITPEVIHTDKLLLVAVLGLGVNLGRLSCV
jgi:Co/Zn/Cd efflux system component